MFKGLFFKSFFVMIIGLLSICSLPDFAAAEIGVSIDRVITRKTHKIVGTIQDNISPITNPLQISPDTEFIQINMAVEKDGGIYSSSPVSIGIESLPLGVTGLTTHFFQLDTDANGMVSVYLPCDLKQDEAGSISLVVEAGNDRFFTSLALVRTDRTIPDLAYSQYFTLDPYLTAEELNRISVLPSEHGDFSTMTIEELSSLADIPDLSNRVVYAQTDLLIDSLKAARKQNLIDSKSSVALVNSFSSDLQYMVNGLMCGVAVAAGGMVVAGAATAGTVGTPAGSVAAGVAATAAVAPKVVVACTPLAVQYMADKNEEMANAAYENLFITDEQRVSRIATIDAMAIVGTTFVGGTPTNALEWANLNAGMVEIATELQYTDSHGHVSQADIIAAGMWPPPDTFWDNNVSLPSPSVWDTTTPPENMWIEMEVPFEIYSQANQRTSSSTSSPKMKIRAVYVKDSSESSQNGSTLVKSSFPPEPLHCLNSPLSPGGHAQLYGVIVDPDTNVPVEKGNIIIYGTTGTYTFGITDGRVQGYVTAPSEDESWKIVLQAEGKTVQIGYLQLDVAENIVRNLKVSSGSGSVSVSAYYNNSYRYTKVTARTLERSSNVNELIYDGSSSSISKGLNAINGSPLIKGELVEFDLHSYKTYTNESGKVVTDHAGTVTIRRRVGLGGSLIDDERIKWNSENKEYSRYPMYVHSDIVVPTGLSLTIDSGAWMRFGSGVEIDVSGSLTAVGSSATDKIYMTSSSGVGAAGQWDGVQFHDGCVANMENVVIEYARDGVYADGGDVDLNSLLIRDCSGEGVQIAGSPEIDITNCLIERLGSWGIYDGSSGSVSISSNTLDSCSKAISSTGGAYIYSNVVENSSAGDSIWISGTINHDVEWGQDVTFYRVTVAAGATLTIKPGVTCRGHDNTSYIDVKGSLIAEGTPSDKIRFTSRSDDPDSGADYWKSIKFSEGSVGRFEHCIIEYAAYGAQGIIIEGGDVQLLNVNVAKTRQGVYAVYITGTPKVLIKDSIFSDIPNWAIVDRSTSPEITISGNEFENCSSGSFNTDNGNGVVAAGNTFTECGSSNSMWVDGIITKDTVWDNNVTFYRVTVAAGATLTIKPGVTCRGHDNTSYIDVKGSLIAEGTPSDKIRFTSRSDDPDSGADYWKSIKFSEGSVGRFEHCIIEYAAYGAQGIIIEGGDVQLLNVNVAKTRQGVYAVYITGTPKVLIKDSIFSDIPNWAIVDRSTSPEITISGNEFENCSSGSFNTDNGNGVVAAGNTFTECGSSNSMWVDGIITKDTVWDNNVTFYRVTVAAGATLTIKPGVTCRGHDNTSYIDVKGSLIAEGTASDKIRFTSRSDDPDSGADYWKSIYFRDGSVGRFEHCIIEYAAYGAQGIIIEGGDVQLLNVNVTKTNNGYHAVYITGTPKVLIKDSIFSDIPNWAIVDRSTSANIVISDNEFENCSSGTINTNNVSGVVVAGNTYTECSSLNSMLVEGIITKDTVWENNVTFNQVTVAENATLTINPGIVCYGGGSGARIEVHGKLVANGTVSTPIIFTSPKSSPVPGDWDGIKFVEGSTGSMDHVVVEFAGGGRGPVGTCNGYSFSYSSDYPIVPGGQLNSAGIIVESSPVLKNVTIREVEATYYWSRACSRASAASGLWIREKANPIIKGITVESAETWGVYSQSENDINLSGSIIKDNKFGVISKNKILDARLVDWGTTSGPYHASLNPVGKANKVEGNVLFRPWMHIDSTFETFESGDWGKAFSWVSIGDKYWDVSDDSPINGKYSAQSPSSLLGGEESLVKSVVNCREGYVSFRYALNSTDATDVLHFYMDDKLIMKWTGSSSGSTPLNDAFKVSEGVHSFKWLWKNEGSSSSTAAARIDDVVLPHNVGHLEGVAVTNSTGVTTPLVGATVTISDGENIYTTTTDENGEYSFFNVPVGDYTLEIAKDNFETSSQSVQVESYRVYNLSDAMVSGVDTSTLFTPTEVEEKVNQEIESAVSNATAGLYTPSEVQKEVQEAVSNATKELYTKEQLDGEIAKALASQPAKTVIIPLF